MGLLEPTYDCPFITHKICATEQFINNVDVYNPQNMCDRTVHKQ